MKTKAEIMEKENEKKLDDIIFAKPENTSKTAKATTVILNEDTKAAFQNMVKKSGLNMGILFNAFMKAYIKSAEVRKAVIAEISED